MRAAATQSFIRGSRCIRAAAGFATEVKQPGNAAANEPTRRRSPPGEDGEFLVFDPVPRLRTWLKDAGCKGVDGVDIVGGGKSGLWLRADAPEMYTRLIVVPRSAWIEVPIDLPDPELDLAWKVLTERWIGKASRFAAYIDFLWGMDSSLHPIFWSEEEIAWLSSSTQGYEEVKQIRQEAAARVAALLARARETGSPAPKHLLSEPDLLEAEVRFAVFLVTTRATRLNDEDGAVLCAAMVPLLDHCRHDYSGQPRFAVGELQGIAAAVNLAPVNEGEELRHRFEEGSTARLLAQYGVVPRPKFNQDNEAIVPNAHEAVALPFKLPPDVEKEQAEFLPTKLKLLAEWGELDLRGDGAAPTVELPTDIRPGGRLLPVARFLVSPVRVPPSGSSEEACERNWVAYGAGNVGRGPPPRGEWFPSKAVLKVEDPILELNARSVLWAWARSALDEHLGAIAALDKELCRVLGQEAPQEIAGGDAGVGGGGGGGVGQLAADQKPWLAEQPSEVPQVGELVLTHYKAKRKGEKGAAKKSRRPLEARLQAIEGDRAVVQFLSNGMRQEVPVQWIAACATSDGHIPGRIQKSRHIEALQPRAPPEMAAAATADVTARLEEVARQTTSGSLPAMRGAMAIQLLQSEACAIEVACNNMQDMAKLIYKMVDKGASERERQEAMDKFSRLWQDEHSGMPAPESSPGAAEAPGGQAMEDPS